MIENRECASGVCEELAPVDDLPVETVERFWSDPEAWKILDDSGNILSEAKVPEEGDDVVIQTGWNMVLDVKETPILNRLTINGNLRFI